MREITPIIGPLTEMDTVRGVMRKHFDTMADGEKITMQDLSDKIVAATGVKVSSVNTLMRIIASEPDSGIYIKVGRGGGIVKGERKEKIDSRPRCPTCHRVETPKMRAMKNDPSIYNADEIISPDEVISLDD
jgi:hypothetical protein